MAVYAAFLSGGSQIGPVIAGYLVQDQGWRWFFILCVIIAAVNLVMTFFLLPETLYEEEIERQEVPEKDTESHIETVRTTSTTAGREIDIDYKTYGKGLITLGLSKGAKRRGILKHFITLFCLPLPLVFIPGVLLAAIEYGVVLGGYATQPSRTSILTYQRRRNFNPSTTPLLSTTLSLHSTRSRPVHTKQLHRNNRRLANRRTPN